MANELKRFIYNFLENKKICYRGEQEDEIFKILNFFNSCIYVCDRPDGFCKYKNNVLIIEHFEFDSSYKNRKGSKNRQEIFRTSNYTPKSNSRIQFYHDRIKCTFTMENYINNLLKNFKEHYAKIKDYKENLRQKQIITKNTNVETLFCIEDTTALGNIDSSSGEPILPLFCTEFIELVKKCSELNYIITGSFFGQSNYTYFSSTSKIKNYSSLSYSKKDREILDLNVKTVIGVGYIPNK